MAGGIEWLRWHHGSVTDPKFALVARKAGTTVPNVLAVWAFLLEKASAADERGRFGVVDCEAIDCLFGFEDGITAQVIEHMQARELVVGDRIAAWEKRQPKREREGEKSSERVRAFRERQRQEQPRNASETPRNATERQETPREEKRREEPSSPSVKKDARQRATFDPSCIELPEWLDRSDWERWCRDRSARRKPITEEGARGQLKKLDQYRQQGHSPSSVIEHSIAGGFQGLYADLSKRTQKPTSMHAGFAEKNYREGVEADGSFT